MADQLSVERGVNCKFQSANGFTPEQNSLKINLKKN